MHENIAASDVQARVIWVHDVLCREYGCPRPYFHDLDPLSELVSSLLSHRTHNRNSGAAYRALRERFPTWELARDAPVEEIEETIACCTWPEQKAPRIKQVLKRITERAGRLSLDLLEEMSVEEGRAWLDEMPGVGPKTSAAVMSFSSLRERALPVDSHHFRVAQRLGWISTSTSVGPSHAILESLLPDEWGAQKFYDHHQVMMKHGKVICRLARPLCEQCPVLPACPYGQRFMALPSRRARVL